MKAKTIMNKAEWMNKQISHMIVQIKMWHNYYIFLKCIINRKLLLDKDVRITI